MTPFTYTYNQGGDLMLFLGCKNKRGSLQFLYSFCLRTFKHNVKGIFDILNSQNLCT